jgi:hydroxymethylpyrimidine/phosphomethylpyrimidine kinase
MNTMMKNYTKVLTIAGNENLGTAGLSADLKTITALACYGMAATTTLVNASPHKIHSVFNVPEDFIVSQVRSVLND